MGVTWVEIRQELIDYALLVQDAHELTDGEMVAYLLKVVEYWVEDVRE